MASNNSHNHDDNHIEHHEIPFDVYVKVFAALIVLTLLTVGAAQMHLGVLAAPVAFLIASTKAVLVMGWFMHLKYDNMLNRVIFGTGFFFLALLFAICFMDIFTRIQISSTL